MTAPHTKALLRVFLVLGLIAFVLPHGTCALAKQGLIDLDGRFVLPPKYDNIQSAALNR
jgi:hypothetical protein